MKLSNVLKVFGAAALVAGLTPYRITKDEETGEKKVRALFWEATSAPQEDGEEKDLSLHVGFFSPLEKEDEEPHFFADELTVEYTKKEGEEDTEECAEEDAAEEPEEAEESAEEDVPAGPDVEDAEAESAEE